MRKFYSALMALSVFLFASCDKNEGDIGSKTNDGDQARVGLTLNFPTSMTKAANDENATANEAAVSSITVFIFESDGSHADGSPANYPGGAGVIGDYFYITVDGNNNKYKLIEPIETTEGTKKIYAAVNLPVALQTMNEDQLKAAQTTSGLVTSVFVTSSESSEVSMISAVEEENLKAYEGNDATDINTVTLTVERMMSKIAVTENGSVTTHENTKAGGKFYITPNAFTVGNIPNKIFPIQKIVNSKLVTPGLTIDDSGNPVPTHPILPTSDYILRDNINAKSSLTPAKNAFYVPEHAPSNSRYDATYAVVRAEFTFEQLVEDVESDGTIKLQTAFSDFTDFTANVVYVVQNSLYTYFCETQALAEDVQDALTDAKINKFHRDVNDVAGGGEKFYAFYYVFINNDMYNDNYHNNDRLALYRNTYYDILVNGVDGLGVPGNNGTVPGDGDDEPYNPPTTPPVDDEDDPDPVYGELAKLLVEINVKPWVYRAPEVTLEPLK